MNPENHQSVNRNSSSYSTCQEILDPHVTPKHNKLLRPFQGSLASNKPEVPRKRFPPTFICPHLNLPKFRCSAHFPLGLSHCILLVRQWIMFSLQVKYRRNIFSQKHCGSGIRGRLFFTPPPGPRRWLPRLRPWSMEPKACSWWGSLEYHHGHTGPMRVPVAGTIRVGILQDRWNPTHIL